MDLLALIQAARFIDDTRDAGLEVRIDALDKKEGIWACESMFECTKACPRGIKITKLINLLKRKIIKYREERGQKINDPVHQNAK